METKKLTIKNVSIGDRFIDTCHRKSKRVSTVVDFIEKKSLLTGEILGHEVVASHEFMGQTLKTYPPFTTVVRYRVQD